MLPHYSSLKVAEVFRMLHALHPGRIDLGVGRAPGGTPLDSFALQRYRGARLSSDDFPDQLLELIAFLRRDFPARHPFSRLTVSPDMPGGPEIWLLGSSMWSAAAAARLGLPYAFAHFIDPNPTRAALEHYFAHFTPSAASPAPRAMIAPGVVCADTREEAERLLSSARLFRRRIRQGDVRPIPSPEEALAELGDRRSPTADEPSGDWPRYFVGTAERARDQLIDMASVLHADELMIVTVVHDHRARMRSYELLAQAFNLTRRAP